MNFRYGERKVNDMKRNKELEDTLELTRKLMDKVSNLEDMIIDYEDEDGYHVFDETCDLWELLARFDESLTKHLNEIGA